MTRYENEYDESGKLLRRKKFYYEKTPRQQMYKKTLAGYHHYYHWWVCIDMHNHVDQAWQEEISEKANNPLNKISFLRETKRRYDKNQPDKLRMIEYEIKFKVRKNARTMMDIFPTLRALKGLDEGVGLDTSPYYRIQ